MSPQRGRSACVSGRGAVPPPSSPLARRISCVAIRNSARRKRSRAFQRRLTDERQQAQPEITVRFVDPETLKAAAKVKDSEKREGKSR